MARIPDEEIERPKKEIHIERLVTGFGVELKRQGKDLFGKLGEKLGRNSGGETRGRLHTFTKLETRRNSGTSPTLRNSGTSPTFTKLEILRIAKDPQILQQIVVDPGDIGMVKRVARHHGRQRILGSPARAAPHFR